MPCAAKSGVHAERAGQCFHLPGPRIGPRKDFLQGDDVCVKATQNVSDALDGNAAVQASGLVDVVGNYTHSLGKFYPFSWPGRLPALGSSLPKSLNCNQQSLSPGLAVYMRHV